MKSNQGADIATNAIILIVVTTAALLVLVGALAVVVAKTWTSHCRGDAISIDDLVEEDERRRAHAAEVEIDSKPRLAG